jgi:hypothetical protein
LFFEKFLRKTNEKRIPKNAKTKTPKSTGNPGGGGAGGGGGGGFPGAEKPKKLTKAKSIVKYLFGVIFMEVKVKKKNY